MVETIEVQLSNYQIEKATARLAYQQAAIRRLGFSKDPGFAAIAHETLTSLETRLAKLLADHSSLLKEQRRAPSGT